MKFNGGRGSKQHGIKYCFNFEVHMNTNYSHVSIEICFSQLFMVFDQSERLTSYTYGRNQFKSNSSSVRHKVSMDDES